MAKREIRTKQSIFYKAEFIPFKELSFLCIMFCGFTHFLTLSWSEGNGLRKWPFLSRSLFGKIKLTTLNWPQKSLWIFNWSTKSKGVELSFPCGGQPRFSIASALHQPQWLKFRSPCPHPTGTQVPTAPGSHPFAHAYSLPLAAPLPFAPLMVLDGSGPSTTTAKWTIIAINLKGKSDSLAYKELHMPSSCLSFSWGLEFMVDSPHYWPYAGGLDGSFWVTWRRTTESREPGAAWARSKLAQPPGGGVFADTSRLVRGSGSAWVKDDRDLRLWPLGQRGGHSRGYFTLNPGQGPRCMVTDGLRASVKRSVKDALMKINVFAVPCL